ncbi:flagellin [Roseovarius aquimarinus]|uniref:Flagellin n=1 Tax=Roseovarius aquimarinus TaxID=1229156 RepID=A0ABW7IA91_9RHOB
MTFHAIGDLAQSLSLRRHAAAAQSDVLRLGQELASGRVAALSDHLGGSFAQLSDMESRLARVAAQSAAGAEGSVRAEMMQSALEHVETQLGALSGHALLADHEGEGPALGAIAAEAGRALESMVGALNTRVAGQNIFAGDAPDASPLAGAASLMSAARAAVAGAGDAASVRAALDTFFDGAGSGFETLIYRGGTADASPHRLGNGEEVSLSIRADDARLRDALKQTVAAALSADDTLALPGAERVALMRGAGAGMAGAIEAIVYLRADLGFAEARIDQSMSRNASEAAALEIARSDLVSADPFETATALEQAQLRLETIYTLTARTQRLNLVNFL